MCSSPIAPSATSCFVIEKAPEIALGLKTAKLEGNVWRKLYFSTLGIILEEDKTKKRPRMVEEESDADTDADSE
jgi:hypothetical protein